MALEVTAPSLSAQAAPPSNQDLGSQDVFLQLLVAQMQYQDPLNPSDSAKMSSDLAQFSMVEQQTTTNQYLSQLAASQGGSGSNLDMASAGYLGNTVMINESEIQYTGTTQNFSATLDQDAETIYVNIYDSLGAPVRTMSLSAAPAGDMQLSWDGRDDAGIKVDQGTYSIDIQAFNAAGTAVNATPQRSGIVDAVRTTPSGVELVVNGIPTSIDNITEVRL